jgi:hypothetical protein
VTQYLQTSTANPYGHRPWVTRLYTGFENYAFLKQPQNRIIREDVNMRPEIYRPPEMKPESALGAVTVVSSSGRVLQRRRTLGMLRPLFNGNGGGSVMPGPARTAAPPPGCAYSYGTLVCGGASPSSPPPPPVILPPSMVPPVPQPIVSGPGGTIYALPGDATTPGSPFAPPGAYEYLPAGGIPLPTSAAAAAATTAAAIPAAAPTSAFSDWFNAQDYIAGIPNGYVGLGVVLAVYMFSKRKR